MQDRVRGPEVPLTQEFLDEMLGVQRTTVIAAAGQQQAEGLIRYQRGRITVVDRNALDARSCGCQTAVLDHFARVLLKVYSAHE